MPVSVLLRFLKTATSQTSSLFLSFWNMGGPRTPLPCPHFACSPTRRGTHRMRLDRRIHNRARKKRTRTRGKASTAHNRCLYMRVQPQWKRGRFFITFQLLFFWCRHMFCGILEMQRNMAHHEVLCGGHVPLLNRSMEGEK